MSLSQDDIKKYKELYLETAKDYLESMQLNISLMLKDEQTKIAEKQIHIDAHSLKSQSQIMGYNGIAKISEIIEDLFNKEEKENIQIKQEVLMIIQRDITKLLDSLSQIEKENKELDLTEIINELEKVK